MFLCGCHGKESFESSDNLFAVDICKTPLRWWRMVGRKSVKGLTLNWLMELRHRSCV